MNLRWDFSLVEVERGSCGGGCHASPMNDMVAECGDDTIYTYIICAAKTTWLWLVILIPRSEWVEEEEEVATNNNAGFSPRPQYIHIR